MWLVDLLVAGFALVYTFMLLGLYAAGPAHLAALAVVSLVICAAHLFRRLYPLAVFAVIAGAMLVHLLLGAPVLPADVLLLVAVYTVASRRGWRISLPVAVVATAVVLVAVAPRLDQLFLNVGDLGVLLLLIAWSWTWGTLVRTRRDYISGLRERARQLERERESQARIAAATERTRIAREMHDIVSHTLSVVVVMSEGAAATVATDPDRARTAMLTVRDSGRNALDEMRRMLGVLRDDEPDSGAPQPGIDEIPRLIDESRAAGLPVSLTITGGRAPTSSGLGLTVYRLVQEALTNVRKHAGPTVSAVDVTLDHRGDDLAVTVTDDGRGHARPEGEQHAPEGHGLLGMTERVTAYGGSITTGERPGGGYTVEAVLPLGGER